MKIVCCGKKNTKSH